MSQGRVYTTENKDTKTDYQKGEIMRNCRNYKQNHLFLCLFEIRIQDFLYREFSFHVLPEKNYHHLKCESHPKFKFDLGPSYTAILKNGSTSHQPGGGGAGVGANYVHIFWFSRYSNFCIFPSLSLSVIVYDVTNRLRKNLKTHIV